MKKVVFTTEGQSEESFVKEVLSYHLVERGLTVLPYSVETKKGGKRGGVTRYETFRNDLVRRIKQWQHHHDCLLTTMIDLYALPNTFPGSVQASGLDPYQRVALLEQAMVEDICHECPNFDFKKFIPYIQLHEFEALIFAEPEVLLGPYASQRKEIEKLIAETATIAPELINHSRENSPSHRIIRAIGSQYDKKDMAVYLTQKIGIERLLQRCPHFADWLQRLEAAAGS